MIARVLPDVPAIDKTFDYLIPDKMHVAVGSRVRIALQGRRVGGWVVEITDHPATDRALKPLARQSGLGPTAEVIGLARWAAWRWAGRTATFLRTASPPNVVMGLPPPAARPAPVATGSGIEVHRIPPAGDVGPIVERAVRVPGSALVLAPTLAAATALARTLRQAGHAVALAANDWARAAAGGSVVVGARAAAWAPAPELGAVVVVDEHDEAYQEERAPTWNARDVAVERALRAGARCLLTSPSPSLEALALGELITPSRGEERAGWPVVEVVDRRQEPPGLGLFSPRFAAAAREAERLVCVLNRKGRARLLACGQCGELARCERCGAAVRQQAVRQPKGASEPDASVAPGPPWPERGEVETLECPRCGLQRPVVCTVCGASRMKVLRVGVTRAREELEALLRRPVVEVTGETAEPTFHAPVVVGTEAVLHRVQHADLVAFLDFDQELLAPRYRAAEQAMALLVRAARLLGGRDHGRLLLQTRVPTHETIDAAVHADPSRLAVVESARRAALRFPPETALALVSGEAAQAFVGPLLANAEVEVLGPADGRWLIRAEDHRRLCDALSATPRPPGRVRVEVDPLRA